VAHEQRGEREGARGAGRHGYFAVLVFLMLVFANRAFLAGAFARRLT